MIKKVLALLISVAIVVALVPGSVAAASPTEVSEYNIAKTSAGAGLAQEREYTRAINKLERFLTISETGNIVLNAPKGIVNSIDSEVYQSLVAGLEQTNSMIDSGYLTLNDDFSLTATDKYQELVSQQLVEAGAVESTMLYAVDGGIEVLSTSGGVTTVVWHWWGFEFYLSHSYTRWIANGLYVGSIVAAFVPEPFASKLAAVLIGGLGALLSSFDNGNGVVISFHLPCFVSVRPQ